MGLLNVKIKATTLVETLVALTIISLVAGFAVSIFLKLSRPSNSPVSLLMAQQRTAEIMDTSRAIYRNEFFGYQFQSDNLFYTLTPVEYDGSLRHINIEVTDNSGHLVYERNRLIYLGNDQ